MIAPNNDNFLLEISLPENEKEQMRIILESQKVTGRITRVVNGGRGRLFICVCDPQLMDITRHISIYEGLEIEL